MFADNVSIAKDAQIVGKKYIAIGSGSCIGSGVWLNVCGSGNNIRIRIGKCVLIGRQSVISTGGYLEIGDYCLFAPRVYVSDVDHLFVDIAKPVIEQGVTLNRNLTIEENCWLGINVVVSGNITVGRGSVVAANSVVLQDIPPFSVVAGIPAKVVKMYDFSIKLWKRVRDEEEVQRIRCSNDKVGFPNREELKKMLDSNSKISKIHKGFGGIKISFWELLSDVH